MDENVKENDVSTHLITGINRILLAVLAALYELRSEARLIS